MAEVRREPSAALSLNECCRGLSPGGHFRAKLAFRPPPPQTTLLAPKRDRRTKAGKVRQRLPLPPADSLHPLCQPASPAAVARPLSFTTCAEEQMQRGKGRQ
jgi:hypothetical protein